MNVRPASVELLVLHQEQCVLDPTRHPHDLFVTERLDQCRFEDDWNKVFKELRISFHRFLEVLGE